MPSTTLSSIPPGPRLVTVPSAWPPYDCEVHGTGCPAAAHEEGSEQAAGTEAGSAGSAGVPIADSRPDAGLADAGLADAGRTDAIARAGDGSAVWPQRFVQVIVEVLAGARSPRQLVPWATDRVRAAIGDLARALASGPRPRIQRVVTSRPSPSVVETTVVLSVGSRSRALALRFEHVPGRPAIPVRPPRPARWLCTELESG